MKFVACIPLCALLLLSGCRQSSEKLVAEANQYHQNKQYKEASILYRKAIAKNKRNAEAYYREGLNELDQGNMAQASQFLRRAVDLKPDNSDAETKLAEIYILAYAHNPKKFTSLLPEIRDLTTKVLRQNSNSFQGLRLQALSALTEKNVDKALESFAKANQIQPHSRELVGWYAETLSAANRPAEAEALVRDMLAHDKTWGPGYDLLFLRYEKHNDQQKAEEVLRERLQNDPSNPAAASNLANYLVSRNRFDEGESVMRRAIADKKSFPNGREALGDFYLRSKKYDQALEQYQAGVKEHPKNAVPYNQREVATYRLMGRRDEALRLAKTLSEKNPNDASAVRMYASLLLETGQKQDAVQAQTELKGLVQRNQADAGVHVDLARAYLAANDTGKALSESLEAVREQPELMIARALAARIYEDRGEHAKALEQTDVALAADANDAAVQLTRDRALIGLNEADKAQPELEALVRRYPGMNDARFALASVYLAEKQYASASEQFQAMEKANSADARGLIGLQDVKVMEGKGEEAVKALQTLVDANPSAVAYRYQLANVEAATATQTLKSDPKREKALLAEAADNYKQILKNAPNTADAWLRLGIMQRELGENDAALASFDRAGSIDTHNAAPFLNRAVLLDALGRKKEAAEAYNKVLDIDPGNGFALNNLAFLNAESGANLDQALTFAQRAKKKYPNNPDISDTLGFIYYQKNLNAEALGIFRQLVQQDPQRATFHLHLAMALLKQGDKQGAKEEAAKALKSASQPQEQNRIRSFASQIG